VANTQSAAYTLRVTFIMCVICSVLVASAAVLLKPQQQANKSLDFKRNVLSIAGVLREDQSIEQQFARVSVKLVDLDTGKFSDAVADLDGFDQKASSKKPEMSQAIDEEQDIAKIGRREKFAKVFLIEGDSGLEKIVLPVRGYGLWSTMSGFIALRSDLNTVAGFGFYEQAETPGLGGEVDNPKWRGLWPGKKVYDENGELALQVIKGAVEPGHSKAHYQVDGLAGATLTSNGVSQLVKYWLGDQGYGRFLELLKRGEA
jgi:Na+-transporting NADH:ubiquinone oxidoreductase subunit C